MCLSNAEDIKQLGSILAVWAHPDDETFTCGGILAAAVKNGQQVVCITATKGEAGIRDESRWPSDRLAQIRSSELAQALKILGISNHHWLNYADGGCSDVPSKEASRLIKTYIDMYKPDTILTFGPDGITGHTDHKAVSYWARRAASSVSKEVTLYYAVERQEAYEKQLETAHQQLNIYYNIKKPLVKCRQECDIYFELSPELCHVKYRALAAMPSQEEELLRYMTPDMFNQAFGTEAFIRAN